MVIPTSNIKYDISLYRILGTTLVYFIPFLVPLLLNVGSTWRGDYCFAAATFMLVVVPGVDTLEFISRRLFKIGWSRHIRTYAPKPLLPQENELKPHLLLLALFLPLYYYSLLSCARVYGNLTSREKFGMILSVGASCTVAMAAGHELGHKRSKICQVLGLIGTVIIGNPHFVYDHASVHHAYAGTPRDVITAPLGMNFYSYQLQVFLRTYPRAGIKLLSSLSYGKVDNLVMYVNNI